MPEDVTETVVEVRVEEVIQLFDTLDPFPFRERDLDKDAEDYIVSWARDDSADGTGFFELGPLLVNGGAVT